MIMRGGGQEVRNNPQRTQRKILKKFKSGVCLRPETDIKNLHRRDAENAEKTLNIVYCACGAVNNKKLCVLCVSAVKSP